MFSPGISLNEKIIDKEKNIKNIQTDFSIKKNEYENIIKNFTNKRDVINLFINIEYIYLFICILIFIGTS